MKAEHQTYYITIGRNLLNVRKQKGLSQQELANKCSVDRAKISKIENGREDFMLSTILEIADALDIKVSKILDA